MPRRFFLCCVLVTGLGLGVAACGDPPRDAVETVLQDVEVQADVPLPDGAPSDADAIHAGVDVADVVTPAGFGEPCLEHDDCEGHICLVGSESSFCTRACNDACPDGFACRVLHLAVPEVVVACVPASPTLCARCQTDAECAGGVCLPSDEGGFCAADCRPWDCPATYRCESLAHPTTGDDVRVCRPASGSCVCGPDTVGQLRSCQVSNAAGTCNGVEACGGEEGWQGCDARVPAPEACNGQDDDCDLRVDEDLPAGQPCEATVTGVGTCTGEQLCTGAGGWVCSARTPAVETCNFQDDDCDGQTDEDFTTLQPDTGSSVYATFEHCGTCGVDCGGAIANAASIRCDADLPFPLCVADACAAPYFLLNPFQCIVPPFTFCNECATDAECYGNSCLDLGAGRYCFRPCTSTADCQGVAGYACRELPGSGDSWCLPDNGTCDCDADSAGFRKACSVANTLGTCFGFSTCDPLVGWTACDAEEAVPEACNGRDDDCDGVPDDGLVGEACSATTEGVGTCWGTALCFGAAGWVCPAPVPAVETCNARDDDCDGLTDEGFVDAGGAYSFDQDCGACHHACAGVVPNGLAGCQAVDGGYDCVRTDCDPGYVPLSAGACVKTGDGHCTPCASDADCAVSGDRCLLSEDGRYCGLDCGPANLHGQPAGSCPAGFVCEPDDPAAPGGAVHCAPLSGSCTCTADEHGAVRICSAATPLGTCWGVRTCDSQSGWSECSARQPAVESCNGEDDDCDGVVDDAAGVGEPCSASTAGVGTCLGWRVCSAGDALPVCSARQPAPESCNTEDDDCDGRVDEGFAGLGGGCAAGVGACRRYGEVVCAADGTATRCSAEAGVPAPEQCNHLDDDCDGQTDEDWPALGNSCTLGAGICRSYGVLVCDEANPYADLACTAVLGPSEPERCNHLDDDCDGQTDEDWPDQGSLCTSGKGRCAVTGVRLCDAADPGGPTVCSATPGEPGPEVCNGQDDDCNGLTDEDWPEKGTVCSVGQGVCQVTGVRVCSVDIPAGHTVCTATPGAPQEEACDGLDNNCDGLTDEVWPEKGTVCFVGTGACQRGGVYVCSETDRFGPAVCDAIEGVPVVEVCNGQDDDCDGQTDEDWPEKGTVCSVAVGACSATGVRVCSAADPGGATVCNATAGDGSAEVCDGLDNDCDGLTDEGWGDRGAICTVGTGLCRATGVRVCDVGAPAGPTVCGAVALEPSPEVCDGVDDDCDGLTDEGWVDKGAICTVGTGTCRATGVRVCSPSEPTAPTVCDAIPGQPATEVCNGLDDDCDGRTDEGWTDKGRVCSVGIGACQRSGVRVCDEADPAGFTRCDAVAGAPVDETCDGLDDDCDGLTDEGWPDKNTACSVGTGRCLATGVRVCDVAAPFAPTVCNAEAQGGGAETCNGQDDDCDGQTDEGWGDKNTVCSVGVGACRAAGIRVCDAADPAGPTRCDADEGSPTAEACDGVDNDCDGAIDELWPTKGTACTLGAGICAAGGVVVCDPTDATAVRCDATPGAPLAAELCNYLDDTCDGQTDEAFRDATGRYVTDAACGNCFTDCRGIYDLPQAYGTCDGSVAVPRCRMACVAGAFDLNAIPDDGCEFVLDGDAVYVSIADPAANAAPGCGQGPVGTGAGNVPCRTVDAGLAEAARLGRHRVLVADGLYEASVTLEDGIDLMGGYRADTWERHLDSTLTTLRAPVHEGDVMTVMAAGLSKATLLEGFVIQGPSAVTPGASSYALWIVDTGDVLRVASNVVQGGAGASAAPADGGADGLDGTSGGAGQATITTVVSTTAECDALSETPGNQGPAGDGGQRLCGGDDVRGGAGAGAECPNYNAPQPAGFTGASADSGFGGAGVGGSGGYDRYSTTCGSFSTAGQSAQGLSGGNGGSGQDGGAGAGCPGDGAGGGVVDNLWIGTAGATGGDGTNGGGGGGGGAGGGADVTACADDPDDCLGGSGGGGGSGGCAGARGLGGRAGGGAFTVFVAFGDVGASVPVLEGNTLVRGYGGNGGDGGTGGAAGQGGDGGEGGMVAGRWAFAMGSGGRGGQGGDGGHGGGGGGGCGGVSYALYVHNAALTPTWHETNTIAGGGLSGAGGGGGPSLGQSGTPGAGGLAGDRNY